MPAAAMGTRRKAMRMTMRRMMAHRTIMAITIMTMTIITMTSIAITAIITAIPMLMTASKAPAKPRRRAVVRTGAIKQEAAPPIGDHDGMKEAEAAALYRLMTWLSPSFPVGAFSYSSGIEWAVESGDIGDAASLADWLGSMLADGPGFCDGVFLAQARRAVSSRDEARLRGVAELAAAFVPSPRRQLDTSAQGRAFLEISRAAWTCARL